MSGRQEWAVTAAEHVAAALRIIGTAAGHAEAEIAGGEFAGAYRWILSCIGTIPGDRTEEVIEATIIHGIPVRRALDAIGA